MKALSQIEQNTRSLNGTTNIDCTALFALAQGATVNTQEALRIVEAVENGTANLYITQSVTFDKAYTIKYPVHLYNRGSSIGMHYFKSGNGSELKREYITLSYMSSSWKIGEKGEVIIS